MNILHITTYLQGGAGQIIANLASSQALSGHNVTVATSGTSAQDYGNYSQWIEVLKSNGIKLIYVESSFTRQISLNINAFRRICQTLDPASISLIHTHAAIPSLIALLLRSRAQRPLPILQTMHGWGINKNSEQAFTDIALMNQMNLVVTTSETSMHLMIKLGLNSELIEVVPNGVASLPQESSDKSIPLLDKWRARGYKIMSCLGTVGKRKNQRLLLQAMAHPKAPLNLACAIIGEGEETEELETFTKENGIKERVHFFGYQSEGAKYAAASDWLVLPSNDEGLPLSILEAYSAGVPVLGSDIPEIAEVISPEQTGILFQSGNVDSLVQAFRKVATMDEAEREKMGGASKLIWQKKYNLEKMLDRYVQIYNKLLHKPIHSHIYNAQGKDTN